ncbi:MAG: pyridoxal-phosphate dependent enzyme [Deferrisomatales bacterium]|nr:pyridoxal-phosphate dependent enzyme [Deferrisomatales bacterium]
MGTAPITAADLAAARDVVRDRFPPTPLIYSETFSQRTGAEVFLKLENLQRTGSFKVRGALCRLTRDRQSIPAQGVVAASAGNHAQGVALAASQLGIPSTVVMPETAPIGKQLATRDYGARVILHGRTVAESLEQARRLEEEGYCFVHPFDDPQVIAGQATVGSEILEQLAAFEASREQPSCPLPQGEPQDGQTTEIWAPLGGGGLLTGIALAVEEVLPGVHLVGVQTAACPSAAAALRAGKPVTVATEHSIADGIVVPKMGELPFQILSRRLDETRSVEESAIALAMVELLERKKLLAEGAGATALAALLGAPPERVRGHRIVVVISGGNVDLNVLDRVLEMGLMHKGRILRFSVVLDDRPGALSRLLHILTREKANILHVAHDRLSVDLPLSRTRVALTAETRGFDHNRELTAAIQAGGYHLEAPI